MSTSKPPRTRTTRPQHPKTAPTYKRLTDDAYAALDELEKIRHDLHLDIDAITDAIPYAELDKRSIGFPSSCENGITGGADPGALNAVEAASQHPKVDTATNWLAETTETRAQITRVANLARYHYGYDPERGRADTTRPQERHNEVKPCAWCNQPAAPGVRGPDGKLLVRVVDQMPIHRNPCYQTAASQSLRTGVSLVALLTTRNVQNRKTAGPPQ